MSITPLFAQTKSQQIAVGPSKPCSLPGIPPQRINEVVDTSHALPASLGSDAIIRVAVKVSPYCPALAKDLLQRAFEQADAVKGDMGIQTSGENLPYRQPYQLRGKRIFSTNGSPFITVVRAGGKGSHFGRFRPEPVVHPGEPPVDGDAVRTLQQFLN